MTHMLRTEQAHVYRSIRKYSETRWLHLRRYAAGEIGYQQLRHN